MYAVVEIAGQQFKVAKDQRLYVHRLNAKEGATVDFDNVLLVDNGGKVNVGAPAISGARVTAKVLGHLKGDKVIVFKKKRRKGFQKSNGHRQYLTQIEIQSILETGAKAKAKEEKPAAKAEPKPEAKAAPKAKETAAAKKEDSAKPETKSSPKSETKTEKKAAPKAEKKAPAKKATPKAESKPKAEDKKAEDKKDNKDEK